MKEKILLLDSLGAFISALFLLCISYFAHFFGVTKSIVNGLIPIPLVFTAYSYLSYKYAGKKWQLYLRIIAIANLLYCSLTLFIVIKYFASLTQYGVAYFLSEIFVIVLLASVELKISTTKNE